MKPFHDTLLFTVTFSYCIDSENRNIGRPNNSNNNNNNNSRRENNPIPGPQSTQNDQQQSTYVASYQYTLADVPKLAEQAANMYAQNPTEKENYLQYYTDYYTKQISQVLMTNTIYNVLKSITKYFTGSQHILAVLLTVRSSFWRFNCTISY